MNDVYLYLAYRAKILLLEADVFVGSTEHMNLAKPSCGDHLAAHEQEYTWCIIGYGEFICMLKNSVLVIRSQNP